MRGAIRGASASHAHAIHDEGHGRLGPDACTPLLPVQDLPPKQVPVKRAPGSKAAAPTSGGARTNASGSAAKAKDTAMVGQAKGDKAKAASGGGVKRQRYTLSDGDEDEEEEEEDELKNAGGVRQWHADCTVYIHGKQVVLFGSSSRERAPSMWPHLPFGHARYHLQWCACVCTYTRMHHDVRACRVGGGRQRRQQGRIQRGQRRGERG